MHFKPIIPLLLLFPAIWPFFSNAQTASWELSNQPGNQASNTANFLAPNVSAGPLSRGTGLTPVTGEGSINAAGWYSGTTPTSLDDAISNDDYYEFSISTANCIFFDADSIRVVLQSSADGPGLATLRSSSDNFGTNIATFFVTTTPVSYNFSSDNLPFTEALTFRLYGYGDPAGGNTPAPGGTMRIGSSTNATDNDLDIFATVSPLAFFNPQANLTVVALSPVGSIPFNTILPGSTINWSRTPEPIGDLPLSGTGNIPGFTTTNNTGTPLVCTFTVNATLGNCTSADMLFTITVDPPPAAVPCAGSVAAWELSMEPGDQLTSESFFAETGIGTCILTRGAGLTPQLLPQGMSTTNWFDSNVATTLAQAIANNDYYEISLPVDAVHQANITGVRFILRGNPGSPKNLALRSSADNFANTLASASLTLNTVITNFNFTAVSQSNGTLIFRLYAFGGAINSNFQPNPNAGVLLGYSSTPASPDICVFGTTGAVTCAVTGLDFTNESSCNNNGTPQTPNDDFYTSDIVVDFTLPPAGSNLILEGVDLIGSYVIPVTNLSGNSHTFNGVQLKADGQSTSVTARFTNAGSCGTQSLTQPGVPPCSGICEFTAIGLDNILCNDNGTPSNPDDDYLTFSLDPEGNNFDSGYEFVEVPGFPVPTQLDGALAVNIPYGTATTFRTANGTAGGLGGAYEIMIVDDSGDCTISETIAAPGSCSGNAPCTITSVTFDHISACDDNGTTDPGDDFFFADMQVSFVNPPATGLLSVSGSDLVDGTFTETLAQVLATGSPFTFLNKKWKADGSTTQVTASFTASQGCALDATGPIVEPCSFPAPVITCPAAAAVSCTDEVPDVNPAGVSETHSCSGIVVLTHLSDVTSGQICANHFVITRTYQATDQCGNITSCSQTITVDDQTPPNLTCPSSQTVACATEIPSPNIAIVTSSDNCSGTAPTVIFASETISNPTCVNRFTITRTYRATDACGNSATCSQVITVNDQTPPAFQNPPANITVDCYLVPAPAQVNAGDNCGSATVTYLGEIKNPGICPVFFTLTRRWLATDICGNTAVFTQIITVTDDRAPQFIVQPQDVMIECGPDNAATFQAWLDTQGGAVVEDCTVISFTEEDTPFAGGSWSNCGSTFQRHIRFTATDECGNFSFRDATFTVVDFTPPVFIHVPESQSTACSDSEDGAVQLDEWLTNQAYLLTEDQCGGVQIDIKLIATDQPCANTWTKKYAFTATDDCGNTAVEFASFSVTDQTPPSITCPPDNLYLQCVDKVLPPDPAEVVAQDQCGAVTVAVSHIQQWGNGCPGSPMNIEYTFIATDACGNTAVCFQQLRVIDNSSSEIFIPTLVEVACVDDIPGPYAVEAFLLALLDGQCNATKIAVLQDLGLTGNTHTYRIQGCDGCRNKAAAQVVTFMATGTCNPLCTATSEAWGSTGADIGFHPVTTVIDSATAWYGGVNAGSFGRTLTVVGSACFTGLVGTGGDCSIFEAGQHVANDSNGCILPDNMLQTNGTLRSELGTNVLALQLNIWYNQHFNNRNLGVQDLKDLPACMIDFSILKALGNHSTWQDLLDLANEYLGAANAYPYPDGFCTLLNEALGNVNLYHQQCTPVPPCVNAHKGAADRTDMLQPGAVLTPNPTIDAVTLWYDAVAAGTVEVRVSGINGSVFSQVFSVQKGNNQIELPIAGLAAGIYAVQVKDGKSAIGMKLVKI